MIKIGVLGTGFLGKKHLLALKEISSFEVVGFFDIDKKTADETENLTGIKKFPDMTSLVQNTDALDIVTSTSAHFQCASYALKKSKHIFIEKPVAGNIKEAKALLNIAREAGVCVQIGHIERFNPAFTAAAPYLDNPMFIEAHRLAEFPKRGTDVSVIHDIMIHDIDIVLSVVKSGIKRISASGVAVISDTPDIANARIEFYNGCVANLTASRISLKTMRKSRFFQRDAYISVDFHKREASIIKLQPLKGEPDPFAVIIDPGNNKEKKQLLLNSPKIDARDALQDELSCFAMSISNHTTPPVTLEDGVNAVETAHHIIGRMKFASEVIQ